LVYAHLNADFPVTAYNDATTAARSSDHDVPVAYFAIPAPVNGVALNPSSATFPSTLVGVHSNGQNFALINVGETALTITSITATGPFAASNACGSTLAIGTTCNISVVFTPTAVGSATGQLQIITSASSNALTASLTGTGAPAPDFTVTDSTGKTSAAISLNGGTSGNVALVFTPNTSFTGTVTLTCASTGTAPVGVTCTPPTAFALAASAVTQNVAFTTTSRLVGTTSGLSLATGNRSRSITALTLAMAGLLMFFAARSRRLSKLTLRKFTLQDMGLFALLFAICIPATGCIKKSPAINSSGTQPGIYNYTVTATSGTIAHAVTIALTVN
jgi:hypothetical protein